MIEKNETPQPARDHRLARRIFRRDHQEIRHQLGSLIRKRGISRDLTRLSRL